MSLIDSLKSSGYCCFDMNYASGTITDSVSGNAGTVSGSPINWSRYNKQRGLYINGTAAITYPDTAANRLAGGQLTIIGLCNLKVPVASNNPRIISKRTSGAGNNEYDFFLTSTTMSFFVNATTSSVTTTLSNNNKFYAVTLVNGAVPKFYLDGNFVGNGNNALTTVASTKPIIVGNFYGLDPTTVANGTLCRVLGYSKVLTPDEISRIYEELLVSSINGSCKSYNIKNTYIKTTTRPKLHWLLDYSKPYALTATDLSGNGNHGTVNKVGYDKGIIAETATKFQGNVSSYITLTNGLTNTIPSNNQYTISMWFKSPTYANEPFIFSNALASEYIQIKSSGSVSATGVRWIGNNGGDNLTKTLYPNNWYHLIAMKTSSTSGDIYINGQLLGTVSNLVSSSATPGSIFLGVYTGVPTGSLNGNIQDFRIYDQNLTKQEIDQLYYEGARKINIYVPMKSCTQVTLGATIGKYGPIESIPFYINVPPINASAPTHSIIDGYNRKLIKFNGLNSNGNYQPLRVASNQAFGTWIFRSVLQSGGVTVTFVGNKPYYNSETGSTLDTGTTYAMYLDAVNSRIILNYISDTGIITQLMIVPYSINLSTIAVTRNYSGVFTIHTFVNGTWTTPTASANTNPSAANLTTTISNNFTIIPNTSTSKSAFSDFRFHDGVLTLDQIKSLYPLG